jgi:tRNA threonylcarbamoyladenosine biosynthesis protein TsaB
MSIVKAAVDLSGKSAGFALSRDGEILRNTTRPMKGRDSAEFAPWVEAELAAAECKLEDVTHWTVGSGPGSFTGMRLAAALVAGWTFGKEIQTRCVPTAVALAARVTSADGDKIGTLFDGRNRELIYFELENRKGELLPTGETAVLNKEQAVVYFQNKDVKLAAQELEMSALELLLEPELFARVQGVEALDISALINSNCKEYDQDLTELVYIRPAVFV